MRRVGKYHPSRESSQIPSFPGQISLLAIVEFVSTRYQTLSRIQTFFDQVFDDFQVGFGTPFGSQNRSKIEQNPSSEIKLFLNVIFDCFLMLWRSKKHGFEQLAPCGIAFLQSFDSCSVFIPKNLLNSVPKGTQIGAKSVQKSVSKTNEFWNLKKSPK